LPTSILFQHEDFVNFIHILSQGVTERCRLSWLTNSVLVYEPKSGGRGRVAGVLANEYSCAHGAQIGLAISDKKYSAEDGIDGTIVL
jgi:hypothetical protein